MLLAIDLVIVLISGFCMYRIVDRYNARLAGSDSELAIARSINPGGAAVLTALFGIVAAPYYFYRMRGLVGVLYGIGWVVALVMASALARLAIVLLVQAL